MKHYPTARPYIGKKEERYVLKALRSGTLSLGPFAEAFEKKFAKTVGSKYAIAVSSGTAGLHLALIAAGIGPGDEVITSPYSFVASANAILYVGAIPVFADISEVTYNIEPAKIEEKITPKTKAIMPVHIYGQMADMESIMAIAKKHNLKVVEDACESLLAQSGKKRAGTYGQSSVFAFYPNKQITTGEGGMIITDDKTTYELCRSLRNQGRAPNMQWLDHDKLGYNYRMDEMSAALGLAQLENIKTLIKKRREIAVWYTKALTKIDELVAAPQVSTKSTHTWFVYVIALKNKNVDRDTLIEQLAKKGVHAKPYLPSIHLFDFYRKMGHKEGECPISEELSKRTLALPFYIGLSKTDIDKIVKILKNTIQCYE